MAIMQTFIATVIMTAFLAGCSSASKKETDLAPQDTGPIPAAAIPEPTPYQDSQYLTRLGANGNTRIALRDDVPDSYTVVRGDTLWDISNIFLRDPWLWPQVWYYNPQIQNPHLIYPGDVITLVYVDGQPQLRLNDGSNNTGGLQPYKLSPRVRTESISSAIPTVPMNAIRPFLINPRIVTEEELEAAPYVLGSLDNHLVTGVGNRIYVRGLEAANESRYNFFRPGKKFYDPVTDELLGMETIKVSEAQLNQLGDPSSLTITKSLRETLNGDRILPAEEGRLNYSFIPKAPVNELEGKIISLVDSISYSSNNQVVVINLGDTDGVEVGNVFAIDKKMAPVRDHWSREDKGK